MLGDPVHKIYKGYYINRRNEILIAVSNEKTLIENYFINHRMLHPSQFSIVKEYADDIDIVTKYSDYVISEYNGYYIPEIDQISIGVNSHTIDIEIENTINNIKDIISLSKNIKKVSKSEIGSMIHTIEILSKMLKSKKILNKLNEESELSDPILFCNMEKYLELIKSYKEMRDMNRAYKNALLEY